MEACLYLFPLGWSFPGGKMDQFPKAAVRTYTCEKRGEKGLSFHDNPSRARSCWKCSFPSGAQTCPQGSYYHSQGLLGSSWWSWNRDPGLFTSIFRLSIPDHAEALPTECQAHSRFCFVIPGTSACLLVILIFTFLSLF